MNKPVVIGSSTGGTQALELVLTSLPGDAPGIAITQHMPEKFTAMYAQRLNGLCAMQVREAKDGDRLERGLALHVGRGPARVRDATLSLTDPAVRAVRGAAQAVVRAAAPDPRSAQRADERT